MGIALGGETSGLTEKNKEGEQMPQHKERPYYKKPEELHSAFGRVTDPRVHEDEEPKKHFSRGTAVLVTLFFLLILWEIFYGNFNPLLFPGACR